MFPLAEVTFILAGKGETLPPNVLFWSKLKELENHTKQITEVIRTVQFAGSVQCKTHF